MCLPVHGMVFGHTKEALTHATMQVNLENMMLSGRSQAERITQCVIVLMCKVQNRQIQFVVVREWEVSA